MSAKLTLFTNLKQYGITLTTNQLKIMRIKISHKIFLVKLHGVLRTVKV